VSDSPLQPSRLAHELRSTLSAVDMLLESALEELESGGEAAEPLAKARTGITEALDLVATNLERER